jgi:hypothetical protein
MRWRDLFKSFKDFSSSSSGIIVVCDYLDLFLGRQYEFLGCKTLNNN